MVASLVANGVDTVFGLPGAQMYPLFDALARRRAEIRVVGARHEQGIAYMAFGYARSTGKLGVFSPVPGPGMLNASAALCTALGACAPVLCLTGEIPSSFRGRGRGHLHELPDQLGILARLTKHVAHIDAPEDVPEAVDAAIVAALSGRPGPAAVSICWDTLGAPAGSARARRARLPAPAAPDADAVATCVRLIRAARQPMIFTGSGGQAAAPDIGALAERIGAPVVAFRGGRGIVGDDRALGTNIAAAWHLWPDVDLIIGIGSRLEIPYMRWAGMMTCVRALPGRKLIRIDIDPAEMERLDTDGPLVADAAAGSRALLAALDAAGYDATSDSLAIANAKARAEVEIRDVQPQMAYLDAIRDVLPRDGFFVEEVSQMGFTSNFGFPVYEPRTYVSCGFQGTLGFGFPTALGVKVAHPNRAVVSVTGDGGFMFAMPELATAVQYGIALVTIVFDNASFGNVLRDQQTRYDGRTLGAELVNPDFVALARSFGVDAVAVDTPERLRPAFARALDLGAPALIHVRVPRGSETSPWRFLHPSGPVGKRVSSRRN